MKPDKEYSPDDMRSSGSKPADNSAGAGGVGGDVGFGSERDSSLSSVSDAPNHLLHTEAVRALSDEEIATLKRAQKRNFIMALLLGIVLLIAGFYAGKALRAGSDSAHCASSASSASSVCAVSLYI